MLKSKIKYVKEKLNRFALKEYYLKVDLVFF
jgi:hypothetical protein